MERKPKGWGRRSPPPEAGRGGANPQRSGEAETATSVSGEAEPVLRGRVRQSQPPEIGRGEARGLGVGRGGANPQRSGEADRTSLGSGEAELVARGRAMRSLCTRGRSEM